VGSPAGWIWKVKVGGYYGNGLLYEVQKEGGDKEPQANHTQKWQTGSARCLLCLRDKGIQDRENLRDCHQSPAIVSNWL